MSPGCDDNIVRVHWAIVAGICRARCGAPTETQAAAMNDARRPLGPKITHTTKSAAQGTIRGPKRGDSTNAPTHVAPHRTPSRTEGKWLKTFRRKRLEATSGMWIDGRDSVAFFKVDATSSQLNGGQFLGGDVAASRGYPVTLRQVGIEDDQSKGTQLPAACSGPFRNREAALAVGMEMFLRTLGMDGRDPVALGQARSNGNQLFATRLEFESVGGWSRRNSEEVGLKAEVLLDVFSAEERQKGAGEPRENRTLRKDNGTI